MAEKNKKEDFFKSIFSSVSKEIESVGKGVNEMFQKEDIGSKVPAINIIEYNDKIEVLVAAPGMEKQDFSLNVEEEVLIIESKKGQQNDDSQNYLLREFGFGAFQRSFEIPESVDVGKIGAAYDKGILTVTCPKKSQFIKMSKTDIEIW